MIRIIVAISKNCVIGESNNIPWHLPNDLKKFRELTLNHAVIMGRKTYESIGSPLDNRLNIILTRNKEYKADNCIVVNCVEDALRACEGDCFVIGGGEIYKLFLPIAHELYLTLVNKNIEGDTYFPTLNYNWVLISEKIDNTGEIAITFRKYMRFTI
jgi:dihydrofolate reductase